VTRIVAVLAPICEHRSRILPAPRSNPFASDQPHLDTLRQQHVTQQCDRQERPVECTDRRPAVVWAGRRSEFWPRIPRGRELLPMLGSHRYRSGHQTDRRPPRPIRCCESHARLRHPGIRHTVQFTGDWPTLLAPDTGPRPYFTQLPNSGICVRYHMQQRCCSILSNRAALAARWSAERKS